METILYLGAMVFITFAGATLACALDWLLLHFAFRLMRPAGTRRPSFVKSTAVAHAGQVVPQR